MSRDAPQRRDRVEHDAHRASGERRDAHARHGRAPVPGSTRPEGDLGPALDRAGAHLEQGRAPPGARAVTSSVCAPAGTASGGETRVVLARRRTPGAGARGSGASRPCASHPSRPGARSPFGGPGESAAAGRAQEPAGRGDQRRKGGGGRGGRGEDRGGGEDGANGRLPARSDGPA